MERCINILSVIAGAKLGGLGYPPGMTLLIVTRLVGLRAKDVAIEDGLDYVQHGVRGCPSQRLPCASGVEI